MSNKQDLQKALDAQTKAKEATKERVNKAVEQVDKAQKEQTAQ